MNARAPWLLPALILAAAVAMRAVALSPYSLHHADEAIQYLEQAHRLVFGDGLVPWEYRAGMRSWLIPLLLAGPMWLGEALAPGTILYVALPRAVFAALAFASVPAAYALGARLSRAHALVAMAAVGLWSESVYFSTHVLAEPLAVAAFLSGAALCERQASARRLVAAGALLALAVVIRFHYAPAVALFVVLVARGDARGWGWLTLGGLIAAAVSGIIDLAFGGPPFAWVLHNLDQNLVQGKADRFGVSGPQAYPLMLLASWRAALVPLLVLGWIGARRYPALAAAALCTLAIHLLIGHKEYRFILLTAQLAVLLAGIGTVDLMARLRGAVDTRATALAAGAWGAAALAMIVALPPAPGWRAHAGGLQLGRLAGQRAGICGLAVAGVPYWATGGRTFLHGPAPLYYPAVTDRPAVERRQLAAAAHGYNAVVAPRGSASLPVGYQAVACRDGLCLFQRSGGCRADGTTQAAQTQRQLNRYGG